MRILFQVAFCVVVAMSLAVVRAQTPPPDHCEQFTTCEICVSNYLCGWCSTPVIYQGNVTGKHCAGYNPNGNDPFECNGIYSIEQCTIGYVCDLDNFQCNQAGAGNGTTLQKCEANCTNMGQVYLCNTTEEKCYQVPQGTPGASSYQVCESACKHPKSAHPAPPHSPAPPAAVFKCDEASGECVNTTAGHGSSYDVCMQQCKKSNNETKYFCNTVLHQCEKAPKGFPGESKKECEAECQSKPNPGPPSNLIGLWRALQIQNGYKSGEFDIQITASSFVMVDVNGATTIKGTPYNVERNGADDLWVKITAGPGAGQMIKAISQNYERGPETSYRVIAFSAPGGKTPSSITDAMKASSGDAVYFMMECVGTPECVFTMPSSFKRRQPLYKTVQSNRLSVFERRAAELKEHGQDDACAAYSANCSYCIAHEHCGWCSQDVIYKGGMKGTQCAGFSSNPNATNPFVCEGRYSTLDCTQGWTCDEQTLQCEQNAAPGNGFPKAECLEVCRPTPSPTPQLQQYVCNTTTHQCHKCTESSGCPGSMPEATCDAACKKPHKGPTHLVLGVWRGLQIQNSYPLVEWDWVFNSTSLTVYRNGQEQFSADVTSYGGDEMIFDVISGASSGMKFSAIYTVADQGRMVEAMTLAMSAPNGAVPGDYTGPMETKGEVELVLLKCGDGTCKFSPPS